MQRASYIPPEAQFSLDAAAREVRRAFGGVGVFVVGSCTERPDYRDVDVRLMLHDDDFETLFPVDAETLFRPRFQILCLAMSAWFRHLTGLPIDFQFQKMSIANDRHKGKRRVPIGLNAFIGDAAE